MPHFLVVANICPILLLHKFLFLLFSFPYSVLLHLLRIKLSIWRAHESQKRAWPQGTNTISALGVSQQISQTLSDDVEAEATGSCSADAADECEWTLSVESSATLSSQLYSSVSEFSSLNVSVMSVQWLTMRLSLFFWRRLGILGILRCCRSLETSSIKSTDKLLSYVAVTRSFCYSTFLLLDVSSPWLLLAVSLTRHFLSLANTQRFLYSTYILNGITCYFTHYPTFQLLDVSAQAITSPAMYLRKSTISLYVNATTGKRTSSSAVAERPRDASCHWIFR